MKFVLYNASHKSTRIVSCDGDAWIRILGFFKTKDQAFAHAKKINDYDPQEIRIAPVGEFRLILRAIDNDRETKKHDFILKAHAENRINAFAETRKNAEEHKTGTLKFSPRERIEAEVPTVHKIVTGGLKKVPHDFEVRMQKFAAIALVPDYEHEKYLEVKVDEWEKFNANEAAKLRNQVLRENLDGRAMPNFKQCMETWVSENPPPNGLNVFGQVSANLWEKNDSQPTQESSFWVKNAHKVYETKVWEYLNIQRPVYTASPPPDTSGDEPAVSFLHAGNTEEEIVEWIKTSSLTTYDIACVSMYEWIKVNDAVYVEKKYREQGLEQLHTNKRIQASEASKLDKPKVIEIEA
jgi:hypothetical protein